MKSFKNLFIVVVTLTIGAVLLTSCEKEEPDKPINESQFKSLESPYLICAGRNPGGVEALILNIREKRVGAK
jgi:hypothetical protein